MPAPSVTGLTARTRASGRPANWRARRDDPSESEGTLWASGLIAGGALVGVLVAFLNFKEGLPERLALGPQHWPAFFNSDLVPLVLFALLGFTLFRGARPSD